MICSKSFTGPGSLKKHLLIHSGEKPHSCQLCILTFRFLQQLILHKENPYSHDEGGGEGSGFWSSTQWADHWTPTSLPVTNAPCVKNEYAARLNIINSHTTNTHQTVCMVMEQRTLSGSCFFFMCMFRPYTDAVAVLTSLRSQFM